MNLTKTEGTQKVHWYGVVIGVFFLAIQHGAYLLGHIIADLIGQEPYSPKIACIDDLFPIVSAFIIIYILSYAYWAIGPIVVSTCQKEHYFDFLVAIVGCLILGIIVLSAAPTYMDRDLEHLFDTDKTDIFTRLRQFWYTLDGSHMAYNLLPSFHCSNSTLCYLGVARRKEVPLWIRVFFLLFTISVYFSTLFVKQHYFLDVFAGITIAVIPFVLSKKFHWGRIIERLFLNKKPKEST